jgi:hypothetical protein
MTPDHADLVAKHLEHIAAKVRESPPDDAEMDLHRGTVQQASDIALLDGSEIVTVAIRWPPTNPTPGFPRWAGSEAHEVDPELDDLTRAQLSEFGGAPPVVASVLDDWLARMHGILSGSHNAGLFLDLLAARGYRVTPIDPGPPFEQLLPPPKD